MNTTYTDCTNHGRVLARRVEVEETEIKFGARYVFTRSRVQTLRNGFVKCSVCNYPAPAININATLTDTPCSKRCTIATGPDCECDCNGSNHGIDA